jgi:PAS domain S-box-containing protein
VSAPLSIPPPDPRLEAVLESISDAFYAVSPEWTFVIFNGAAEQYFGVTRDQVLGQNMWEVFPPGVGRWPLNGPRPGSRRG